VNLAEAFRELGMKALGAPALLERWGSDGTLAMISDADPELFAALAPQLSSERALDFLWLVVRERDGRWTLKSPAYAEAFRELAEHSPPEQAVPLAADIDEPLFLELAPKLSSGLVLSILSEPRHRRLIDTLRKKWPAFDLAAGAAKP
jgi:hypothetical protein